MKVYKVAATYLHNPLLAFDQLMQLKYDANKLFYLAPFVWEKCTREKAFKFIASLPPRKSIPYLLTIASYPPVWEAKEEALKILSSFPPEKVEPFEEKIPSLKTWPLPEKISPETAYYIFARIIYLHDRDLLEVLNQHPKLRPFLAFLLPWADPISESCIQELFKLKPHPGFVPLLQKLLEKEEKRFSTIQTLLSYRKENLVEFLLEHYPESLAEVAFWSPLISPLFKRMNRKIFSRISRLKIPDPSGFLRLLRFFDSPSVISLAAQYLSSDFNIFLEAAKTILSRAGEKGSNLIFSRVSQETFLRFVLRDSAFLTFLKIDHLVRLSLEIRKRIYIEFLARGFFPHEEKLKFYDRLLSNDPGIRLRAIKEVSSNPSLLADFALVFKYLACRKLVAEVREENLLSTYTALLHSRLNSQPEEDLDTLLQLLYSPHLPLQLEAYRLLALFPSPEYLEKLSRAEVPDSPFVLKLLALGLIYSPHFVSLLPPGKLAKIIETFPCILLYIPPPPLPPELFQAIFPSPFFRDKALKLIVFALLKDRKNFLKVLKQFQDGELIAFFTDHPHFIHFIPASFIQEKIHTEIPRKLVEIALEKGVEMPEWLILT